MQLNCETNGLDAKPCFVFVLCIWTRSVSRSHTTWHRILFMCTNRLKFSRIIEKLCRSGLSVEHREQHFFHMAMAASAPPCSKHHSSKLAPNLSTGPIEIEIPRPTRMFN